MDAPLSQKKFKLELEFTVTVDEVDQQHLTQNLPLEALPYLKQLQDALVNNEPAMIQQIMMQIVASLQQYTDHLAAQNDKTGLQQIDAAVTVDDCACFNPADLDFLELTRPVRVSAINAQIESCTLNEKLQDTQDETRWEAVWSDLWMQSELVRGTGKYPPPSQSRWIDVHQASSHFFFVRYLTQQKDGVHCEALCSCGRTISGVGENESHALETAWGIYQKHLGLSHLAKVELQPSETLPGKN